MHKQILTADVAVYASEPLSPWLLPALESASDAPATLIVGAAGAGADELALAVAAKMVNLSWPLSSDWLSELQPPPKSSKRDEWHVDKNADLLVVSPLRDNIPVDAARRVIEFCGVAPLSLLQRIAILLRAENLNRAAANALLKTLEEPSSDKSLILSARAATLLPPTIVSRCRMIKVPTPTAEQAQEWVISHGGSTAALDYCGGLPFAALTVDGEKIAAAAELFSAGKNLNIITAAKFCTDFGDDWLACLQKWVADGVRASYGLAARYFRGAEKKQIAMCANPHRWLACHAHLLRRRPLAAHPLARDLFIKEILQDYRRVFE